MNIRSIQVDEIQPYRNQYKEDLVRIGVIDGNIFHAVMAAYSDRYLKSTLDKRMETVKMIRKCIGDSITKKQWQTLQEQNPGIISKQFINIIHTLKQNNYEIIHSVDNKKLCDLLLEILYSTQILRDIALRNPSIDQIMDLVKISLKETLRSVDQRRVDFFYENMIKFINDVWVYSRNNTYEDFKESIKNHKEAIGEEIIPFISSVLNRDIYLFKDGKLRHNVSNDIKGRKSIILDQLSETQFSTIGKRLFSSDIEWSFEPDCSLISKLNPRRIERSPMSIRPKERVKQPEVVEKYDEEHERNDEDEPCPQPHHEEEHESENEYEPEEFKEELQDQNKK